MTEPEMRVRSALESLKLALEHCMLRDLWDKDRSFDLDITFADGISIEEEQACDRLWEKGKIGKTFTKGYVVYSLNGGVFKKAGG